VVFRPHLAVSLALKNVEFWVSLQIKLAIDGEWCQAKNMCLLLIWIGYPLKKAPAGSLVTPTNHRQFNC
jgi:hypothetical protein